jgi:hypothetical protein
MATANNGMALNTLAQRQCMMVIEMFFGFW